MLRDFDGDPTTKRYNNKDMKPSKTHAVHQGRRSKKDIHHAGESSWKEKDSE